MNNQSGTVKMYSEKMCKSQTVQVKAPEIRIGGSIKFYDKQKDFVCLISVRALMAV